MRTVKLTKEDTLHGYLMLVTPEFPIKEESRIGTMVPVKMPGGRGSFVYLEAEAEHMLCRLLADLDSQDRIVPVSGYRSHEEQIQIWEDTMQKEGEAFTRTFVAKPGHSEHESGLAIDLAENREKIDFICPEFPKEGICGQFRKKAPAYGFIERYPEDRTSVTGIGAEPWHFRYVGKPHGLVMEKEGLILEEYIAFLREETSPERPYRYMDTEISYIDMKEKDTMFLRLPKESSCQISGTNEGGIILTRSKGKMEHDERKTFHG